MAIGLSGSNGGIGPAVRCVRPDEITERFYDRIPLEISYFINNVCNLNCAHCYVNYEKHSGGLSAEKWKGLFSELIGIGARTFGNVGMEPLLSWRKTREIMLFLRDQKTKIPDLRFGLVTNGTLMDNEIVNEMAEISPDYIDVSIDGNEATHDAIRGEGMFEKTMMNLETLTDSLKKKVFISFTLNQITAPGMEAIVPQLAKLGIRHFLISPYATVQNVQYDHLWMPAEEMAQLVSRMTENLNVPGTSIYVKSDYDTSRDFMEALVDLGLIDLKNLSVDKYGVVFSLHEKGGQKFYFNWLGVRTTFIKDVRISHDGFVSGCLDMFFKDYPHRAIGNVSNVSTTETLRRKSSVGK